ncbi:hypothetical protein FSBG_01120 [Fusobacterium gonidiaformans 3-1-5R]|uniref:Uncharacterized protein n=2 Tax=Fusobacterium TaxID=848 RepID=E5BGK0_9FUSO|nr:hypothetical protein FSBG_01120 [Fusobacterium gonidiaformans 3-1-5R]KXA13501.1 hypothetical protein HMPREF3206_01403 [Fusobacterium equinum]
MEGILKKAEIVKKFRSVSIEDLEKEIQERGKYKVFSEFAEIMDKRSYFTVDIEGGICRKKVNPILLEFPYEEDTKKLASMILSYGAPEERQVIHEISRLSNIEIPKLKEKLMTTLVNRNFDFAKRYAKELFLRDERSFWKVLNIFVELGEAENQKREVLKAFEVCMNIVKYDERLFHLYLSFLTRYRDNY